MPKEPFTGFPRDLTPVDRRRLASLRRRSPGGLSDDEAEELESLRLSEASELWDRAPWYGPRGSKFTFPPPFPRNGRPPGVTGRRFAELVEEVQRWREPTPPTQEQIAERLYGSETDDSGIREVLRKTGWDWESFLGHWWRPTGR